MRDQHASDDVCDALNSLYEALRRKVDDTSARTIRETIRVLETLLNTIED